MIRKLPDETGIVHLVDGEEMLKKMAMDSLIN